MQELKQDGYQVTACGCKVQILVEPMVVDVAPQDHPETLEVH
jgi:hypothetical protein